MDGEPSDDRFPFAFGDAELSFDREEALDAPGAFERLVSWGIENRLARVHVWSGLPVAWVDPIFGRTHWAGDRPVAESEIRAAVSAFSGMEGDEADFPFPVRVDGGAVKEVMVSMRARHAFGRTRQMIEICFPAPTRST